MSTLEQKLTTRATYEAIVREPDTEPAHELATLFENNQLNRPALTDFLGRSDFHDVIKERTKVENLIDGNESSAEADLSTRAAQLVWAAGLAFIGSNTSQSDVHKHPLYRALIKNSYLTEALALTAHIINVSVAHNNPTMSWGVPGSGFGFSAANDRFTLDPFVTLLLGFEGDSIKRPHTLALSLREAVRSEISLGWTNSMLALQTREREIMNSSDSKSLALDEVVRLWRIRTELDLRLAFWKSAENVCINRVVADGHCASFHDLRYAINKAAVVLRGYGIHSPAASSGHTQLLPNFSEDKSSHDAVQAATALANINRVFELAFLSTNGFFDGSDYSGWDKISDVRVAIEGAHSTGFETFLNDCIGSHSLAQSRPSNNHGALSKEIQKSILHLFSDARNEIIDLLWESYARNFAQLILDMGERELRSAIEDASVQTKQEQKKGSFSNKNNGGGQSSSDQKQDGENGGDGRQEKVDQNKPSGGENASSESQSTPVDSSQPGGSEDVEEVTVDAEDDSTNGEAEQNEDKAENSGKNGIGKTESEGDKVAADNSENGDQDAKSLSELAATVPQQVANLVPPPCMPQLGTNPAQARDDSPPVGTPSPNLKGGSSGRKGYGLKPTEADLRDAKKFMIENAAIIDHTAAMIKQLRLLRVKEGNKPSRNYVLVPPDLNLHRFADERPFQLKEKIKNGDDIIMEDFNFFREDSKQKVIQPAPLALVIIGDSTGSAHHAMTESEQSKISIFARKGNLQSGRAIDAIQRTMFLLWASAHKAKTPACAGVWKDSNFHPLADFGMSPEISAKNLQAATKYDPTCDMYNPALPKILTYIVKHAAKNVNALAHAGRIHFLFLFDGSENKIHIEKTTQMFLALFRIVPEASVQIAYFGGLSTRLGLPPCTTPQIIAEVKKRMPQASIFATMVYNPSTAAEHIVSAMHQELSSRKPSGAQLEIDPEHNNVRARLQKAAGTMTQYGCVP